MNQPWRPERETSVEAAVALVRSSFPDLEFADARILAAGWDNTVMLFGENLLFRFPRRAIALPGIAREIAWLPWIAERVELPVPVPAYVGDHDGWPFWGGTHLAGDELAQRPEIDRVPVATAVGRFLRQLHDTPPMDDSLPIDPFARADSAARSDRAHAVLADLGELGLWTADTATNALLEAGSHLGSPAGTPVLSHGDLYSRHVLVDAGGTASGIIDWGDLCMALPAVDIAIAFSAFTGDARTALFDAYGPVDEESLLRAKTFAVFSAASVAHYAHDVGDEVLLAEALNGLRGVTAS